MHRGGYIIYILLMCFSSIPLGCFIIPADKSQLTHTLLTILRRDLIRKQILLQVGGLSHKDTFNQERWV